ncbi:MAG: Denitrification system component NirT [Methyloprofundus sp.]|nr:Denitrification system component NirT [Methyloprofundus sp.]
MLLTRRKAYFVVALLLAGAGLVTGFNVVLEKTNTLEFCISCHSMASTVYPEYKQSSHYLNRTGVRAECADCHVPQPFIPKIIAKLKASKDVYHEMLGSVDTQAAFEAKRLQMAQRVWQTMKETDSRECRSCHTESAMQLSLQKRRAQVQHRDAEKNNETCIDCHKGIAHKPVHKDQEQESGEVDFML